MKDPLELYKKHYINKDNERLDLFIRLSERYEIRNVLYPGSFVHITPSLVFPRVVYVDSYKKAADFFEDQSVYDYIEKNKLYRDEVQVTFHKADYAKDFGERQDSFDLLISQSAGFISLACKKYLKINGLLLVNNSHGDASMASIDNNYKLIASCHRRRGTYAISEKALSTYFIPKSNIVVTRAYLERIQRGIGYTKTASGYVFRRV
jgi:hypothetical protein